MSRGTCQPSTRSWALSARPSVIIERVLNPSASAGAACLKERGRVKWFSVLAVPERRDSGDVLLSAGARRQGGGVQVERPQLREDERP